jgi:uroporphyrinogen-III decarboxylase
VWYQVQKPTIVPTLVAFLPSWYSRRHGFSWGRRYYFDTDYRTEIIRDAQRTIFEHFGDIGIGSEAPKPDPICADYGNASLPAILGCEVEFPDDNFPWSHHLPESKIDTIKFPDDIESAYPVSEWIRQCRHLERKYDTTILPRWDTQGVQNVAVHLWGDKLFTDYYENPEHARWLLDISEESIERSFDYFRKIGHKPGLFFHANCTVIMISPELYNRWLFPYEQRLYEHCHKNGYGYYVHHCGVIDKYLPSYRQIPKMGMLEIGWESDIKQTMELFPKAIVQYIIHVNFVRYAKPSEIQAKMQEILEVVPDKSRFRISIPDLDSEVPDENIKASVEALLL